MENLSPTQTQKPANSTLAPVNPLPNLPISSNSHIVIHPEHEQGNLAAVKSKDESKFLFTLVILGFLGLLLTAGALFTYFIPRSEIVSYTKNIKEIVTDSGERLDKVDLSLDTLYKAITVQKADVIVSGVLGANTETTLTSPTNIFSNTQKIVGQIKESLNKNSKVKGYTIPADDPAIEYRKHRDLAREIGKNVDATDEILSKLTDLRKQTVPASADEIKEAISQLETHASEFVDQAKKSADYYIAVSDASIELLTLSTSINTIKDLDNTISKFSALKSKFANYSGLPDEIEAYNSDLVEMFTLASTFISDYRDAITSGGKPVPSIELYAKQMRSLESRSINDEISFWQNNESLSSYQDISNEQTDLLKQSQKLKDDNYYFFLRWLGVD